MPVNGGVRCCQTPRNAVRLIFDRSPVALLQPALMGSVGCWPMAIDLFSDLGASLGQHPPSWRGWRKVSPSWGAHVAAHQYALVAEVSPAADRPLGNSVGANG